MGVARSGNSFTSAINRWSIRAFERSRAADSYAELEALEQAFSTLDAREKAAQVDLQRATARDLRHQAQQKRAELAELNAATALLLAELTALEQPESPFTHSCLSSQPIAGAMLHPITLRNDHPDIAFLGHWEMRINQPSLPNLCLPRSRRLRIQIQKLEVEAAEIEAGLPRVSVEAA